MINEIRTPITQDLNPELAAFKDITDKEAFLHTASRTLAQAVKRQYPDAKPAIGSAIDNGRGRTPGLPADENALYGKVRPI